MSVSRITFQENPGESIGLIEWSGVTLPSLEYSFSGLKGGDSGHGSSLRIHLNSGGRFVELSGLPRDGVPFSFLRCDQITMNFTGDDEIKAAIAFFEVLGRELPKLLSK